MNFYDSYSDLDLWILSTNKKEPERAKKAFGELFERYFEDMTLLVFRLGKGKIMIDECADIAKDYFLKLEENRLKRAFSTKNRTLHFRNWLKGNVTRFYIDYFRKTKAGAEVIRGIEFTLSLGLEISIFDLTEEDVAEVIHDFSETLTNGQKIVFEGLLDGLKLSDIRDQNGWSKRYASDRRTEIKKLARDFLPQRGIALPTNLNNNFKKECHA